MERVTVRFFKVESLNTSAADFDACLVKIAAMTPDKLFRDVDRDQVQMDPPDVKGKSIQGDLIRIQRSKFPSVLEPGTTKGRERLKLPEGKLLGHHAAFIYDRNLSVLAYQISRSSVSLHAFNEFVSTACGAGPFIFKPVLLPAELKQLATMTPRMLEIKVAEPQLLADLEDGDEADLRRSLINLKEMADGMYVKVQVGLGRKKGSLDKPRLQKMITWLLEQRDLQTKRKNVRTIKLTGKEYASDHNKGLDFIRGTLSCTEEIELDRLDVGEHVRVRLSFVNRSLEENRKLLEKLK